jgi:hypothetical protein
MLSALAIQIKSFREIEGTLINMPIKMTSSSGPVGSQKQKKVAS